MGMLLYLPEAKKEKEKLEIETIQMRIAACAMQGWRMKMEDSHIIHCEDDLIVFGVFDGHGGREVAKYCSENFVTVLKSLPSFQKGQYEEALKESFVQLDNNILSKAGQEFLEAHKEGDSESNAGCTANVALIIGNDLWVSNAGDSRSVMSRNGQAIELSVDHKPLNDTEKKRIENAGGFVTPEGRVNGNLNLSRAIGDFEYKKNSQLKVHEQIITCYPDVKHFTITDQDEFIIMGCDGIWETKSNQQMVQRIYDGLKETDNNFKVLEHLLEELVAKDTVQSGGIGCDNMSSILVTFKKPKNQINFDQMQLIIFTQQFNESRNFERGNVKQNDNQTIERL